jgi:hypothetical protein
MIQASDIIRDAAEIPCVDRQRGELGELGVAFDHLMAERPQQVGGLQYGPPAILVELARQPVGA